MQFSFRGGGYRGGEGSNQLAARFCFAPCCQVDKTLASLSATKRGGAPEFGSQRQLGLTRTRGITGFAEARQEPTPFCHGHGLSPRLVSKSLSALQGNEVVTGQLSPLGARAWQPSMRVRCSEQRRQPSFLRRDLIFRHCPQMFGLPSNRARIGLRSGGRSKQGDTAGRRAELVLFTRLTPCAGRSSRSGDTEQVPRYRGESPRDKREKAEPVSAENPSILRSPAPASAICPNLRANWLGAAMQTTPLRRRESGDSEPFASSHGAGTNIKQISGGSGTTTCGLTVSS